MALLHKKTMKRASSENRSQGSGTKVIVVPQQVSGQTNLQMTTWKSLENPSLINLISNNNIMTLPTIHKTKSGRKYFIVNGRKFIISSKLKKSEIIKLYKFLQRDQLEIITIKSIMLLPLIIRQVDLIKVIGGDQEIKKINLFIRQLIL